MADDLFRPLLGRRLLVWCDKRFPLSKFFRANFSGYYVPKNLDFWYLFGFLALLALAIQLLTGIFLVMHYKPDAGLDAAGLPRAFASVEHIMREVPGGWFIRYTHAAGASLLFVVIYLHIFRSLRYGSHRKPRELVWISGVAILLCLMAEAFFGYVLPWGQMSGWGARVVANLFSAIPLVGPELVPLVQGDYVVGDAMLARFFALHVIAVPLVLMGLAGFHVLALRTVGSGNPDGIEMPKLQEDQGGPLDHIPFHPYYTAKDVFAAALFLFVLAFFVFFAPEGGGYILERNNLVPYDPLKTPAEIVPAWYFAPFYAMLRAMTPGFLPVLWGGMVFIAGLAFRASSRVWGRCSCLLTVLLFYMFFFGSTFFSLTSPLLQGTHLPAFLVRGLETRFWGLGLMACSVLLLLFLPWLDRSPVKSIRYKGLWPKSILALFATSFVLLGYLGTQATDQILWGLVPARLLVQACTTIYLGFFVLMPWHSGLGHFRPEPERLGRK